MQHITTHFSALKDIGLLTAIITFTVLVLFAAAQQNPEVTCDDCATQENREVTITPSSPGEITHITVCTTADCSPDTSQEDVLCQADTDSCTYQVERCPTVHTQEFWIHVETGDGRSGTTDKNTFTIRKPNTYTCSCIEDNECVSDRCRNHVCTASTPPTLYFK